MDRGRQVFLEPRLPYSHLNLRKNPFGELEAVERQALALGVTDAFAERLREPGFALQFIGAKGRGKTSSLLALRKHFPSAPYVYIGEGENPPIPRAFPLLIDEAQRLCASRRRGLFSREGSFAIATHEDLAGELASAGLSVRTIYPGSRLSPERLAAIFQRRIEHVRRGPGPVPIIRPETIGHLMQRYGDDVRSMEEHLYERIQSLEELEDV